MNKAAELDSYRQQIAFVDGSNISVSVNRTLPSVVIEDNEDITKHVMLQEHQASEFLNAAEELYETSGDLTMDECHKVQAYPYLYVIG